MNRELLIEYLPFSPLPKQLNEIRANPNANLIVSGKVQAANKPNANNRVYDANTLRREIDKYIKGPIAENRALGELDHPESSIITLKNVCHNLKKLWWQGDDVYGEFEILPTPSGEILKQLFLNPANRSGFIQPINPFQSYFKLYALTEIDQKSNCRLKNKFKSARKIECVLFKTTFFNSNASEDLNQIRIYLGKISGESRKNPR